MSGMIKAAEMRLGGGGRFKKLSKEVGSPALAAWIGRKKYGNEKFNKLAQQGKHK